MEIIKFGEQNWANDNCKLKSFANGEQIIDVDLIKDPPPIEEKQFKF